MVYLNSDEQFVKDSDRLLKKLNKAGLWDKDTLVIGLDKSVRPLTYILKRLSKLKNNELPDIRFFNYSGCDYYKATEEDFEKIARNMKKKFNPSKVGNYKNILVLDEYVCGGDTMRGMAKIMKNYLSEVEHKPTVHFASLNVEKDAHLNHLIYADTLGMGRRDSSETGIEDKYSYFQWSKRKNKKDNLQKSMRVKSKKVYRQFIGRRISLSKEVSDYLTREYPELEKVKTGKLEKAVQVASIMALLGGFIFGYNGMTGNIIGSVSSSNIIGTVFIVLGILGLTFSQIRIRK